MPHIRFHDLRHSCASYLVSNGFQLKDIQEWLGHADIDTTANIYAHLYFDRKSQILTSLDLWVTESDWEWHSRNKAPVNLAFLIEIFDRKITDFFEKVLEKY